VALDALHLFEREEQVAVAREGFEPRVVQVADGDVLQVEGLGGAALERRGVMGLGVDALDDGVGEASAGEGFEGRGWHVQPGEVVADAGAHLHGQTSEHLADGVAGGIGHWVHDARQVVDLQRDGPRRAFCHPQMGRLIDRVGQQLVGHALGGAGVERAFHQEDIGDGDGLNRLGAVVGPCLGQGTHGPGVDGGVLRADLDAGDRNGDRRRGGGGGHGGDCKRMRSRMRPRPCRRLRSPLASFSCL